MVVAHAGEAARAQGRGNRVGVGAAHLVIRNGIAGFDQFIAGRDDHDGRLTAHAHPRHAGRRGNRDFRRTQQGPRFQQQGPLTAVVAAPIHIMVRGVHHGGVQRCIAVGDRQLLYWNDAIAAERQNRARHDFDGVLTAAKLQLRRSCRLNSLNAKAFQTAPQRFAVHGHPIHGDAIEGRLVALRVNIFAQRAADTLRQRQ